MSTACTCASCALWDRQEGEHGQRTLVGLRTIQEPLGRCRQLETELALVPLSMGAGPKVAVYTRGGFGCSGWVGERSEEWEMTG